MSKKGKKWIVLAAPCMADLVFPGIDTTRAERLYAADVAELVKASDS